MWTFRKWMTFVPKVRSTTEVGTIEYGRNIVSRK